VIKRLLVKQPIALLAVAWLLVVGFGLARLWTYAESAGPSAKAPRSWPAATRVERHPSRSTLVMFVHPQCACTRATLGELAILMRSVHGRLAVRVLVYRPSGAEPGWEHTDLWDAAAAIPDVVVSSDQDAIEATRFGAYVSGQALLYDTRGRLEFSGGLTFARGHSGENEGLRAVRSLLLTGTASTRTTPVFGCLLRGALPS
jgi:hypothetical protein